MWHFFPSFRSCSRKVKIEMKPSVLIKIYQPDIWVVFSQFFLVLVLGVPQHFLCCKVCRQPKKGLEILGILALKNDFHSQLAYSLKISFSEFTSCDVTVTDFGPWSTSSHQATRWPNQDLLGEHGQHGCQAAKRVDQGKAKVRVSLIHSKNNVQ